MTTLDSQSTYDHQGAIIYTVVTLIFYSLSLFCTLILNIDPDDHYQEKSWLNEQTKSSHSNQTAVLNTLSNESVREKYWRIYYSGNDGTRPRPENFFTNELKRLSFVSKRKKELNFEQNKHLSRQQKLQELHPTKNYASHELLPASSTRIKFRRARSTSVPGVFQPAHTVINCSNEC